MLDVTLLLIVATVGLYIVTLFLSKRKELIWLNLFVAVCSLASLLIDETLKTDEMLLLMVPAIFVMLISSVKVMGLIEKW